MFWPYYSFRAFNKCALNKSWKFLPVTLIVIAFIKIPVSKITVQKL